VDALDSSLHRISGTDRGHFENEAERLSGLLRSNLDFADIGSIFKAGLHQYLEETQIRLGAISSALSETYCRWL
jgi:uncharacterized alpha-E superfamily protein